MKVSSLRGPSIVLAGTLLFSCTSGTQAAKSRGGSSPLGTHSDADTPTPALSSPGGSPSEEGIPSSLRRPLHLPTVRPGGMCPTSTGRQYMNSLFGGIALGSGPVLPLVGVARPGDQGPAKQGVLRFHRYPDYPGWFNLKTLWFSFPSYQGPVFIRGRQLDGSELMGIGEGAPSTADTEFAAGPTVNGGDGFREWPGGTWLRATGCYAWQVDGLDFSYVIVFTAEFER